MKKPKRYDKNYTAAENQEIRILKGQGWTNNEIAYHMGRTEIGISRHWSEINKRLPRVRQRESLTGREINLIINTMRETCRSMGFRMPFVNIWDDRKDRNEYGAKVYDGYKWPDRVWANCMKAVQRLGFDCYLASKFNRETGDEARSRGLRIKL
jgi:hypothetical protein